MNKFLKLTGAAAAPFAILGLAKLYWHMAGADWVNPAGAMACAAIGLMFSLWLVLSCLEL